MSVDQVQDSTDGKAKLDGSVKFYFGDTPHPPIVQNYGNFTTNKKTNGFAKAPEVACTRVAVSALIQLQNTAKNLGGNAVVNIVSFFKQNEGSHDTQLECYKGFIM
ncbi:MAG: excinuclease ATPase subunit, partial [Pseudomonadota bacterium]